MRFSELIFYIILVAYITDGGMTLIQLVHGPQPKVEAPSNQTPKDKNELKPSW